MIFYISLTLNIPMMNKLYLLAILSFAFLFSTAQENDKIESVPKIITKISIGKSFDIGSKSIRFIDILEDSRCPSDVTCVWAGQAKAKIQILENGSVIEEKIITFGASGVNPKRTTEILKTDTKTILGYNISPYPKSSNNIPKSEYTLDFILK